MTNDRRPMTDNQRLTTEELTYSSNRTWQHQHPTNNVFEVWQDSTPFGGRPIGGAIEALATKVIN
jgi:hypothetical protein